MAQTLTDFCLEQQEKLILFRYRFFDCFHSISLISYLRLCLKFVSFTYLLRQYTSLTRPAQESRYS
jgi:hypothetical protein